MGIIASKTLYPKIAEIFNLPAERILSFKLEMDHEHFPRITLELAPDSEQLHMFVAEIHKYGLVELMP